MSKSNDIADLKERIARARNAIAYADRCDKEAKGSKFPPLQLAIIKSDADAIRKTAKELLRILLAELKGGPKC